MDQPSEVQKRVDLKVHLENLIELDIQQYKNAKPEERKEVEERITELAMKYKELTGEPYRREWN